MTSGGMLARRRWLERADHRGGTALGLEIDQAGLGCSVGLVASVVERWLERARVDRQTRRDSQLIPSILLLALLIRLDPPCGLDVFYLWNPV
jgi:hypothetical protein